MKLKKLKSIIREIIEDLHEKEKAGGRGPGRECRTAIDCVLGGINRPEGFPTTGQGTISCASGMCVYVETGGAALKPGKGFRGGKITGDDKTITVTTRSGIQSPIPPEGGGSSGGSPTLTPMYTVIE